MQAVAKLDVYILELNTTLDKINVITKEAFNENYIGTETQHLFSKVTEQMNFILNFKEAKLRCIEICREIEKNIQNPDYQNN